jgi:hypothetical protein
VKVGPNSSFKGTAIQPLESRNSRRTGLVGSHHAQGTQGVAWAGVFDCLARGLLIQLTVVADMEVFGESILMGVEQL